MTTFFNSLLTHAIISIAVSVMAALLISLFQRLLYRIRSDKTVSLRFALKQIQLDTTNIESTAEIIRSSINRPQVFLAHAHADGGYAIKLSEELKSRGIRVWLAAEQIGLGDRISDKILEGLQGSGYCVAILSKASLESPWMERELKMALNREREGKWPHVFPVLIEPVKLPSYLGDKFHVESREGNGTTAEQIVAAIRQTAN
jgi:hypothetical protein